MCAPIVQKVRPSPPKFVQIAVLAAIAVSTDVRPAAAQTPELIFSVGKFVAEMGIAGPACGVRDRVWATRLTYKFRAALNALPPQIVAQLPERSADSPWNAMIYEQEASAGERTGEPKGLLRAGNRRRALETR